MNIFNGINYVEVKDLRYKTHPTENNIIRERDPPKIPRTQYQVQNNTQIRKNQKVIGKDNDEIVVKIYPEKKQLITQQRKTNLPDFPSCKKYGLFLIKLLLSKLCKFFHWTKLSSCLKTT